MAPIDGPRRPSVIARLAYWHSRRTLGHVVTPVKIHAHHPRRLRGVGAVYMAQEAAHSVPAARRHIVSHRRLIWGLLLCSIHATALAHNREHWEATTELWRKRAHPDYLASATAAGRGANLLWEAARVADGWSGGFPGLSERGVTSLLAASRADVRHAQTKLQATEKAYELIAAALQESGNCFAIRSEEGLPVAYIVSSLEDVLLVRALAAAVEGRTCEASHYLGDLETLGRRVPRHAQSVARSSVAQVVALAARRVSELGACNAVSARDCLEPLLARVPSGTDVEGIIIADVVNALDVVERWSRGETVTVLVGATGFPDAADEWVAEASPAAAAIAEVKEQAAAYAARADDMLTMVRSDPQAALSLEGSPKGLCDAVRIAARGAVVASVEVGLTRVGLGLRAYREVYGAWPPSLDVLEKTYFPGGVPRDLGDVEFIYQCPDPHAHSVRVASRGVPWLERPQSWDVFFRE